MPWDQYSNLSSITASALCLTSVQLLLCFRVSVSGQHVSVGAVLQHAVCTRVTRVALFPMSVPEDQWHKEQDYASDQRGNTGQVKRHVVILEVIMKKAWWGD